MRIRSIVVGVGAASGALALGLGGFFFGFPAVRGASSIPSQVQVTVCGDSSIQGSEQCDNGRQCQSGSACFNNFDCVGDGDGLCAARSLDGCSATCQTETAFCGNGLIESGEQCDNGLQCSNLASCSSEADCAGVGDNHCLPRNNDGCSATCQTEGGGNKPPASLPVSLVDVTVRPEGRWLGKGNNYDADFYLTLLSPDDSARQTAYSFPFLISASTLGVATLNTALPETFLPGTYDALIKPKGFLALLLDNISLVEGENRLNFTTSDNGPSIGSRVLAAGDLDGAGDSFATAGDNTVNAIDLSLLLYHWGSPDPTGNSVPANLNQDQVVDEADLALLLNNLDKEGDR